MSSSRQRLYLDYNASTPIAPEVAAVMREAIECAFGNPSSAHWAGVPARRMAEEARRQVTDLLGCTAQEVVFTSGGSEANNFAIKGAFFASRRARRHVKICLLDPDGDIVRLLKASGRATRHNGWVCYHTDLYVFEEQGLQFGVVGCAVAGDQRNDAARHSGG